MKNGIFLSYAGEDGEIAQYMADEINRQIGDNFYCHLVEATREGDTTFTDKIIGYFRTCNIFLVLLTKYSIKNQFVNQEWGYAKALKEIGQIQIIQHITEKCVENTNRLGKDYDRNNRIISMGFISQNMEFIDLELKDNSYNTKDCTSSIISFLMEKQNILRPIATERQQKLKRFINENSSNCSIALDLSVSKDELKSKGSLNPDQFSYDYALQIIQVGHLFPIDFIDFLETYIIKCKRLNAWKDLQMQWILSKDGLHEGNVKFYFYLLDEFYSLCFKMEEELKKLNSSIDFM
jgi:hypothetical protein